MKFLLSYAIPKPPTVAIRSVTISARRCVGLALLLSSLTVSCGDSVVNPELPIEELVDLAPLESVNFDALGSGRLSFLRKSRDETRSGIYVLDIDARTSYGFGGIHILEPALSPDGERFAFTKFVDQDAGWDVYTSDSHGRDLERLSFVAGRDLSPGWFANGSQIAYFVNVNLGTSIYRQSPTAAPNDRILVYTSPFSLLYFDALSVSAMSVAVFVTYSSPWPEISALDLESGSLTRVWQDSSGTGTEHVMLGAPTWSPDGRHIAFIERISEPATPFETLRMRLKVIDADGTNGRTVAALEGSSSQHWGPATNLNAVAWSPDGSKIAFNHFQGDLTAHIYVVGVDGSGLQQVTSAATEIEDVSLSWVP